MSVQEKINKILWNRRVVFLDDAIERPNNINYVFLKDITLEDRNFYLLIKEVEYNKARKDGVPSEIDNLENARLQGYWSKDDDDIEANADKHIAFLESEFEAKKKFKSRQNIIKVQIEDAQAKKKWVARKRSEFRLSSAEYLAHEIASFALLRRLVLDENHQLLLRDDSTFLQYKNQYVIFLYFLIQEIMNEGVFSITDIRDIAKSTEWRLIWTLTRENLSSLFNRPIGDLTLNHKLLIYWSRIYDSAIESTNPPNVETIQSNDLFDDWLANRDMGNNKDKNDKSDCQERGQILDGEYIETCTCGAKDKNKHQYLGEKTTHTNSCLYGTWHKYTAEEKQLKANQVYNRNSKGIRQLIDNEQENISKRGLVEEQHLRNKKTRDLLGLKTKIIPIKNK